MKNTRLIGLITIAVMLVVCTILGMQYSEEHVHDVRNAYAAPLAPAPREENPTASIDAENDYVVPEDFTTHLPLVILDLPEGEPPITLKADEEGILHPIEGIERYVPGTFSLIENGTGKNCALDAPSISSSMNMRRRGNSSMGYAKAQWMVKLVTESGQDNDQDILGMGAEHEWILNGSLADKSMMRNYLSYSLASEFMPFTPDYQYCEVLLRVNGELHYQGVYLLGENIKQGEDRVNIRDYKKGKVINSYMIRRDRFDDDGIMLDTYARLTGRDEQYFGLIFPGKAKNVSEDMISFVEKDVSNIERVLYSEKDSLFYTYPDVIDVNSFVDYFLLNEFLINYDAGNNSTYAYKDYGGKLTMGPVWDYDGATDNYWYEPVNTGDLAFETKAWFDMLCTDKVFVQKLIDRYAALRRTTFADEHVTDKINEIVAHIGGAQEREWLRWNDWYSTWTHSPRLGLADYEMEDGTILYRNATTFADELYRTRTALKDHGEAIPGALQSLKETAQRDSQAEFWQGWMLLFAALLFLIPSAWVAMRR